ncbi:Hpt domain-containing protein [Hyphomonas sp. WL0036]|uniref:Hpt domain-containing protein n=1 Tax=Hyphomonas sediminis TaxID=2866160 RepID=UPI001C7F5649|nr:Hpt domain-containing protein [Hyphomonas sediminis]MBY9067885.1 Hpt domain-containing protein [Hyphomonas sediminis]
MLGKFLKVLDTGKSGRKPAQAVVTPDISRVIKASGAQASYPLPEPEMAAEFEPELETAPEADAFAESFDDFDEDLTLEDVSEAEDLEPEAPADMETQAEEALDALTEEFEGWMRNDLEKMRDAWRVAQKPQASADDYRSLYTCAHNIRGAAPSYGFPAVSRLCGSLCTLLSGTRPGENAALINLHIEACRAAVAAGPQGEGSESVADAVCEALEDRVTLKLANAS